MELTSESFEDGAPIPARFAFCDVDPEQHAALAGNRSPHLSWRAVPAGARSLVLTCVDGDVPTVGDDVNQAGRSVPVDLPRTDFAHWLLIDLAPADGALAEGACSDGVTAGGKREPAGPPGTRQGVNDYTGWFAGDAAMRGTYRGYDGPGPPWNDERVHRYRFELLALDVSRLDVGEEFHLADVRSACAGHVLARASLTGTYTMNPRLR